MKMLRVGIVGTGFIARAHLDALRRVPGVEIAAVCGRNAAKTEAFARQNGVPAWYTDVDAMIAGADLSALHNCSGNAAHDGINRAAIAAGLHVYAEKPLSDSAETAREMWTLAEAAGIVHGLNHQYRMNAAVQEMRTRIEKGEAGRVFLAGGRYHQQSGLLPSDYKPRMREKGVTWALCDIGTHWVDTACCALGQRIDRVFANVQTVHVERLDGEGKPFAVTTDDLSSVLVVFENGAQGAFTVSKVSAGHMNDLVLTVDAERMSMAWAQESPNHLSIGLRGQPNQRLQMDARLVEPSVSGLVTLPGGHPLGWNDALLAAVSEYYAVIRGEIAQSKMRIATFADGYALMAFVEAAVQSSSEGRWVQVAK